MVNMNVKSTPILVALAALLVLGRVDCGDPWGENLQPRLRANFLSQKSGKRAPKTLLFTATWLWSTMSTRSRVRHNEVRSPASLALRQVIHCSRMLLRRQSRLCKRFLVSRMICQKFRSLLGAAFKLFVSMCSLSLPRQRRRYSSTSLRLRPTSSVYAACLFALPLFSPSLPSLEGGPS